MISKEQYTIWENHKFIHTGKVQNNHIYKYPDNRFKSKIERYRERGDCGGE
jgi:hypothetical protein